MKSKAGVVSALALTVSAAAAVVAPVSAQASGARVLYVAPNGNNHHACTRTAPCRTIQHAVAMSRAGDTVLVAPGTYAGQVVLGHRVRLLAQGAGVEIDATGSINGIAVGLKFVTPTHPKLVGDASGSVVAGFLIENATQEGIVAVGSNLTIADNIVAHNDLGAFSSNPAGECQGQGEVPGDCGEGIHLAHVMHSWITGNFVTGNTGGILVSDEVGPTAYNHISRNTVVNNISDCGITDAGHNGNAVSKSGKRQPSMGGVYHNWITGNTVSANGAAGIGFFAGGPGTGVYGNIASRNTISSNGLPGIAVHTHTPGADANGNWFIDNSLSRNGLGNPAIHMPPGDPGTPVNRTTDIDVVADPGATPITGTLILGNRISDVRVGVWLVTGGGTAKVLGNTFTNVAVHVRRS